MSSPEEIIRDLLQQKKWAELNDVQKIAVEGGLLTGRQNFVVIAPTASGKTGIAELAMLQSLREGRRVAYLVPLSSIINEKKVDFDNYKPEYTIYPSEDSKVEYKNANIVLMTFENFYKQSLLRPDIISTFGLIVVDEFHVLYDKLRGYNLEKVLTMIKIFGIRLICLSATFENKETIAAWLNASIIMVPSELRPVPLIHSSIDLKNIPSHSQVKSLYGELEQRSLFPAIIFCSKRADTQSRAIKFAGECKVKLNSKETVTRKIEELLDRTTFTEDESEIISCIEKGVAFHHSGLRLELRHYIEELFRDRKIKYLFSTTGLAYGVNFPAKCVVLYDIDIWNQQTNRYEKIPVYVYLQMAGRAGRPQFGTEGFAYVVAKDKDQLEKRIPEYLEGQIEDAISQIGNDDFFQKTILELIYAGKNQDSDILSFFGETYYNFLSHKAENLLVPFDLLTVVKRHAQQLYQFGFILPQGAAGYTLTDLGNVTIDFLFNTYIPYELTPFVKLDRHLADTGKVQYDFEFLYTMFKIFPEINTSKIPRKRSEIIEKLFHDRGMRKVDIGSAEYSTYATYYGWIENLDEVQIEQRFWVNAHPLASNARELRNLLEVYKKLADKRLFRIPSEFEIFSNRIYYGVTEEELPIIKLRGIGREASRSIRIYCNNVLKKGQGYQGQIIDILCSLYKKVGEKNFMDVHVQYVPGIGPKKAELITLLVKEKVV